MNDQMWLTYADAFAFIGNSLLKPMTQTETIGLDLQFWDSFPTFDDSRVASAIERCRSFAERAQESMASGVDEVEDVSVVYTKLFIGPPQPAAAPWETMNRQEGVTVGFGEPTFQMQQILRSLGLVVSNENNQYADHMGIELLTLSEMCRRVASGEGSSEQVEQFVSEHPGGWVEKFDANIHAEAPDGYYDCLVGLAGALLESVLNCSAN